VRLVFNAIGPTLRVVEPLPSDIRQESSTAGPDRSTLVYLARHGQTESNLLRRYAGRSAERITDLGRGQMGGLAARLGLCGIGEIWTSEVARAHESADLVARILGVPVRTDARLNEIRMGPWEGLTEAEVAHRYPAAHALWCTVPDRVVLDGRETLDALAGRVLPAVHEAARQPHPVLLMTHVAPVRVGVLAALSLPLRYYKRLHVANGDAVVVDGAQGEARRLGEQGSLKPRLLISGAERLVRVKALLLAAGEGTRLRPLTVDRPKPMVEIGGAPAIAHSLRWLRCQGVTDVAINLHHHPDALRQFVGDGSRFGPAVTYSLEPAILGTSGALRPLVEFFRAEAGFVVLYGDVLTDLDLRPVLRAHAASGADATLVVVRVDDPTRTGIVAFDAAHRITRLVEKPAASDVFSEWANAGIYVCGPAVLRYVSADGPQDFARDLFPAMLRDGCHLLASPTNALVIDFGSAERLEAARGAVRRGALGRATVGQPC